MIPFWYPNPIVIVPDVIEFHVFGILVGIGVLLGSWIAQKRAETMGLDPRVCADLVLWVVVIGFIVAHQVSVFAYFPERVFGDACTAASECLIEEEQFVCQDNGRCSNGDWLNVLWIWNGISSYGGFLGAFLGFVTFFRMKRIKIIPGVFELVGGKDRPILKYLDCLIAGFSVGWFFGRLGCFSAHDHVGVATDFFLAVNFPDGWRGGVPGYADIGAAGFTPRMDLGFMEVLWCIPIMALFYFWARHRKNLRPGWYAAWMILPYAPYRFYLDTLRAVDISGADRRYLTSIVEAGVTPGQIGSIVLLALGVWIWWFGGRLAKDPDYMAWTGPPEEQAREAPPEESSKSPRKKKKKRS